MEITPVFVIAAIGLLINLGMIIAGAVWAVARISDNVKEEISDLTLQITKDRAQDRAELEEAARTKAEAVERKLELALDGVMRGGGDGLAAMRQKIHDVEMYIRDQFLRKESAREMITEVKDAVKGFRDAVEGRLIRMENKLDKNGH